MTRLFQALLREGAFQIRLTSTIFSPQQLGVKLLACLLMPLLQTLIGKVRLIKQ
jgi:hypothetical protein